MKEQMKFELQLKILKELFLQVNGNESLPLSINYSYFNELDALKELIEKKLIKKFDNQYYLSQEVTKFLNDNKIIFQELPLSANIETKKILKQANNANKSLAELKGLAKTIPNSLILINSLVLQEAKDSSGIENIITTNDELYRAEISVGTPSLATKEVQYYSNALKKGFELVIKQKKLSMDSIIEIQKELESTEYKQGIRKNFGTAITNKTTNEILHIPPQDYNDIVFLFKNLESYINSDDDIDPLIKLAVIHHQFETIHPFPDGNGRTGRIINILYLILTGLLDFPILYLSSYLIKNKNEYYDLLQSVRLENKWEDWILFNLKGIEETSNEAIELIDNINKLMIETKEIIKETKPKLYSKDLLELLFLHPYIKINFITDILMKDRKTSSKILNELTDIGILEETKIGREKYFINIKLFELLKSR